MNYELIIRLAVAAALGGLIGLEREYRAKEAGLRTHFLVALGSALFMVISLYGFDAVVAHWGADASFDPSRVASQVVPGIGFIGAGTIIFQKHVVRGLTTAAGLWVTAAIGLTCGSGLYVLALAATVLVLICLEAMSLFHDRFGYRSIVVTFTTHDQQIISQVIARLSENRVDMDSYDMHHQHDGDGEKYTVTMELKVKRKHYQDHLIHFMREFEGVSVENIE